jgi:hypothetical protein
MNYNYRLTNIENAIKGNNRIKYCDLLSPAFVYSGKPFNSYDEMFKCLNVCDVPEYLTFEDKEILFDKGLSIYDVNAIRNEIDRMI